MSVYKPSELRDFLESLGVSPKKRLSQNFLIDGNILRKIVSISQKSENLVVEIGPGPGALTEMLLEAGYKVVAIEKDAILAEALKRFGKDNLTVYEADAMEFPVETVIPEGQKAQLIANLPYHLTTPILSKFVVQHQRFSRLVVMVQEEVARRFTAKPGTSEYSSFTIFLEFYSKPQYCFTVSRNCFYPVPKVDSAVVALELHAPKYDVDEQEFFKLTRTAFGQRRKTMRASLKGLYAGVSEALMRMGLSEDARPEELSLEQFVSLYKALKIQ